MFQYRIYPTKKQATRLNETLEECRWLYNHLLAARRDAYKQMGQGLTLYQQHATYPALKQERPSLCSVYSQGLAKRGRPARSGLPSLLPLGQGG